VFDATEDIARYRASLERRLDEALEDRPQLDWRDALRDGCAPSFHWTHHGASCRAIKEKFARLFAPSFPKERVRRTARAKIRVGFLCTATHEVGFVRGFGGIMERLDRREFEVVGLASAGIIPYCRRAVRADDVLWVGLPHDLELAWRAVQGAQCDAIMHWHVGTDVLNYFLPFLPLAPVQCISFGGHGTTGVANLDYFVSSRLFERGEDAAADYTERLVQFAGATAWQPRPRLPPPASRADFGLPESGAIYLCPHQLPKFHPDFDSVLRRILQEDADGHIVALEGTRPRALELLRARLQRTLGTTLAKRVLFLPMQRPDNYYRLLGLGDAILVAPIYSASLTGYDAFAAGIPAVTLPGELMVQRYALGLCRQMGMMDLVAGDESEYVALSVRLGRDADFRHCMRRQIEERRDVLFGDDHVVREYEAFFREAVQGCE
jgi:predicted O-linked N-acetylglucosamine transferase (SPINDLY family)